MKTFFTVFSGANFMPHGHCYFWQPDILWSHAISDGVIATAYFSIPLSLIYIFRKKSSFKYIWVMILFAVFICGCGITHVMDVITIWNPLYRLDSIFRIITAMASIATAIVLVKITPDILKIPTSEEWQAVNEELRAQINQLEEKDRTIEAFRQFEFLTETLPQLVFTAKTAGTASFYNQRWYEYTGLEFESSLANTFQKTVIAEQALACQQEWYQSVTNGTTFEMELQIRRYDGEYRWHLARAIPFKPDGIIVMWVCTLTDIHSQKLQNQQLDKMNRELSIINNDLDNFIYTASHDLKAPIANLEGLTTLLTQRLESKMNAEEKKMMGLMDVSISKFKRTIGDLTEITKAQKEVTLEKDHISFQTMLEDVQAEWGSPLPDDIKIITHFDVPEIKYAKKNLRSILYNLVSNAIKYRAPERPLLIHINTAKKEGCTELTIADNGLGIRAENLPRLFTMFKRFHTHVEGSGIGLYIIKRIIENNGGQIKVESEEGKGTTFRILF